MPFITTPDVRKVKEAKGLFGRARWRLSGPLIYQRPNGEVYSVPIGFETDFASVPRLPMAYFLAGDAAHMSAALHDFLCRELYAHNLMSWREAADVFLDAMRDEGVPSWRSSLMYFAVRLARKDGTWGEASG